MHPDLAPHVVPGERPSAGKWNQLADMASQNQDPQSAHQDATGICQAPPYFEKELIRYCTVDDHPGFGLVFEAYQPGVWNPTTLEWDFICDADHTVEIIDQDYGVPTPAAGAQGYAHWQASDLYGRILVVVTMDCESRGPCCS